MSDELHAVVDCETLGLTSDAVVLSVAVCTFDPYQDNEWGDLLNETAVWNLNVALQMRDGRVVDPETHKWWREQSEQARIHAFGGCRSAVTVDHWLNDMPFYGEVHRWWARGNLDYAWLSSLGYKVPYYAIRDTRTLLDDHTERLDRPENFIPHVAEHDASWDAYQIQRFYRTTRFGEG